MSNQGTGNGNIVTRRPAESGSVLAGAIGAVILYLLNLDQDIAWAVPIIVGAIPAGITRVADYIAKNWGRGNG